MKTGRCSYCGEPGAHSELIGQCRVNVCDDSDCNRQFDDDVRDAEREADAYARERAEQDNYERYRW